MRHFALQSNRPHRSDYEPISISTSSRSFEEQQKSKIAWQWKVLIAASCLSVGFYAFLPPQPQQNMTIRHTNHTETIPTLLSVRDMDTNQYIYALDNPLYDELEQSVLHDHDSSRPYVKHAVEYPIVYLDWNAERVPALKVRWTTGQDATLLGKSILQNDDILVLQCGDSVQEMSILEAVTLGQIKAMHAKHVRNYDVNTWYIRHIPSAILRQPYCQCLVYQKLKPREYYIAAESVPIQFGEVNKPMAIHLALTEHVDRMTVQFVTGATGTPVAQFGTNAKKLTAKAIGTTDTYTSDDMCQAPANETAPGKFLAPGYLHTVELMNLQADTVYYYKVGLETGQGVTWSNTYQVTTALPAGDATAHTFLVYGDQGCPNGGWDEGRAWVTAMAAREPHIRSIHHVGDLSYANGAAHMWDAWFDMIQPLATQVPLMIAVGNHEYDHESGGLQKDPSHIDTDSGFMPSWGDFGNDSGGECGVPTAKRFTMPATGNGVFWYSYDYGLVHTVVLSSEHDMSIGSPQRTWLENDLHHTDRSVTPWLIVESHRPFYEGEKLWNDYSVGVAMRLEMEDLLYDYNVDVVIAGHYHAYQRT
jgi:Purple acid Phosphatase, N-terminal domain/Calcineurin-like phosphoesterase